MEVTAAQLLRTALQCILVQGAESDLQADEYQDALFILNTYMLQLDANGVSLGYTEIDDLSDIITVPPGAIQGVIANVAILCAPQYQGVITPGLMKMAEEGERAMRKLGQRRFASAYPSTLPIGSGNEGPGDTFGTTTHFYADLEAEILAETTGAIGLETDTAALSP